MSDPALDQFIDHAIALSRNRDDFVTLGFLLLALAVSQLPAGTRREEELEDIEGGSLRSAVERYANSGARLLPEVPYGPFH
jgi:hypothetical protein